MFLTRKKKKYSLQFLTLLANAILDLLKKEQTNLQKLPWGQSCHLHLKFNNVIAMGDMEARSFDPIPLNLGRGIEDDLNRPY